MLFRHSTALIALITAFLIAPVSQAQQEEGTALHKLDAMLADIRTLSADVEQLIVESDGGVLEESQIRMYLKKPGGFYWETLSPFPELVVTNGTLLWNYQPDLEQVVIEDWDSERSELAAQLLSGNTASLSEEYSVSLDSTGDDPVQEFHLTPLASDSIYSTIMISFEQGELDMIHLRNKNGEQTVWRFVDVQRNQELASSLFEFDPPDGIEVIENTYVN